MQNALRNYNIVSSTVLSLFLIIVYKAFPSWDWSQFSTIFIIHYYRYRQLWV